MKNTFTKVKLKDACERIFSGGTPDTRKSEYWNGAFKWLLSGETRNRFIKTTEKTITQEGIDNSSTKLAKKGDVLVASAGQGQTRGQTSFCLNDTYINQSIISLRANKNKLNPLFLFYFLTNKYQALRDMSDANSIRGSLTCKMFENLDIVIPEDTIYQERISTLLYNYDLFIDYNTRRIQLLEQMAKLIYDEWFVKFKFPGHEHVKMVDSELEKIPEGWEIRRLAEFIKFSNGKAIKNDGNGPNSIYGSNGIIGNSEKYNFEDGIIIGRVGAYCGSILYCKEKFWASDNSIIACAKDNKFFNPFIFYLLNDMNLRKYAGGSAQPLLTQSVLNHLVMVRPPDELLKIFFYHIEVLIKQRDTLVRINENLSKTRDLLLPNMISGEIDVSELNIKIPMEVT